MARSRPTGGGLGGELGTVPALRRLEEFSQLAPPVGADEDQMVQYKMACFPRFQWLQAVAAHRAVEFANSIIDCGATTLPQKERFRHFCSLFSS